MGYRPPPPPEVPLRGDRETQHLEYLREMYVLGHIGLEELERRTGDVLAGGIAWDLAKPPAPTPDCELH